MQLSRTIIHECHYGSYELRHRQCEKCIDMFLELANVFTTMDHSIQLYKLKIIHLGRIALKHIKSYVLHQHQRASVGNILLRNSLMTYCDILQGTLSIHFNRRYISTHIGTTHS